MSNQVRKNYLLTLLMSACTLVASAQGVVLEWAKLTGSVGSQEFGLATTTDKDLNVYTCGQFDGNNGPVDFDPGPGVTNVTASYGDAFISKFDAAGNFKWVRYFGSRFGEEKIRSVKTDMQGNVYVTGECYDSVDFNPGGLGGILKGGPWSADVFVVKYKPNGDFIWAKRMGSFNGGDIAYDMQLDDSANIYIIGEQSDTSDFDPGPGVHNLISGYYAAWGSFLSDIFVCKLDSAGNFKWAGNFGSTDNYDYGYGITVDKFHNVYTTGKFRGTADLNPSPTATATVTSTGAYDIFLCKWDVNGNYVWGNKLGGGSDDEGLNLAIDTFGNLYTTGHFANTADFDPGSGTTNITSRGGTDIYICRYTSNGDLTWARSIGGPAYDYAEDLTLDVRGNPFVTGFFENSTVDLDPGPGTASFTSNGDNDTYIVKLDMNGNYKWAKVIGGTGMDVSKAISVDNHGSVYTAGYVEKTVDFDPNAGIYNLTSNGGWDFYEQKLLCIDTNSSRLDVAMCEDSYMFNNQVYTTSGLYSSVVPNMAGCDSTIRLNLDLKGKVIKPLINVNIFELGTTMQYAGYQWLKNGTVIPGATNPTYNVTENAGYRVVVSNARGCTDTSDTYTVTNVGIGDLGFVKNDIKIYPNPASDIIYITSPVAVDLTIMGIDGRIIKKVSNAGSVSVKDLANGMYILHIADENGTLLRSEKIAKQDK